jgi:hypothetical protein
MSVLGNKEKREPKRLKMKSAPKGAFHCLTTIILLTFNRQSCVLS